MYPLSLSVIIVSLFIIMGVAYYFNQTHAGLILCLAIITSKLSNTQRFLIKGTTPTTSLIIHQSIIDIIMLVIFSFGLYLITCNLVKQKYFSIGGLYKLFQENKFNNNIIFTITAILSTIGLIHHQLYNIENNVISGSIALVILIGVELYLYNRSKQNYIISRSAKESDKENINYDSKQYQEQQFNNVQSQENRHNYTNKNQEQNYQEQPNYNTSSSFTNERYNKNNILKRKISKYRREQLYYKNLFYAKINKIKERYNNNNKQYKNTIRKILQDYHTNLNKIAKFTTPKNSTHITSITDDDYHNLYIQHIRFFLNKISPEKIDNIINQGNVKLAYSIMNHNMTSVMSFNYKRMNFVLSCIKDTLYSLKKTHLLNSYFYFNLYNTRHFLKGIMHARDTFIRSFIGDVGEQQVRRYVLQPERQKYEDILIRYPKLSFDKFLKQDDFYIHNDLNLYMKSRKSLNNQIDVLVINRRGLFAFEVKTYGDKYLRINNNGYICESNSLDLSQSNNQYLFEEKLHNINTQQIKHHKKPLTRTNIYKQTQDHIFAIASLFKNSKSLTPYDIKYKYCHSPLVWVKKPNAVFTKNNNGRAKKVECLTPKECWLYMEHKHNTLTNQQVKAAINTIKAGWAKGHIKGVPFQHYILNKNIIYDIHHWNNFINIIFKLSPTIKNILKEKSYKDKKIKDIYRKYLPKVHHAKKEEYYYKSKLTK